MKTIVIVIRTAIMTTVTMMMMTTIMKMMTMMLMMVQCTRFVFLYVLFSNVSLDHETLCLE